MEYKLLFVLYLTIIIVMINLDKSKATYFAPEDKTIRAEGYEHKKYCNLIIRDASKSLGGLYFISDTHTYFPGPSSEDPSKEWCFQCSECKTPAAVCYVAHRSCEESMEADRQSLGIESSQQEIVSEKYPLEEIFRDSLKSSRKIPSFYDPLRI